jgi:hypothetical protein
MKTHQESGKGMMSAMTKKNRKRIKGSSTPGIQKGDNCHATGLDKAMAKYPRNCKNNNKNLWDKWDDGCAKFWK